MNLDVNQLLHLQDLLSAQETALISKLKAATNPDNDTKVVTDIVFNRGVLEGVKTELRTKAAELHK